MAFSYNKKNLANTTITGAITSSDTSITVDDATVFPSGYFYATLMPSSEMSTFSNSEIVLVTNISSNTLTIVRAQKNTTARAFSAGAIITNGVYTEDLDFAQSVGKKIFSATWGGQDSPYYKITDDMLKVVPDDGTSIRVIFDTDYDSGTANLSINESTSGAATVSGSSISITDAENLAPIVNGAYVADDNTRNVAPVKAGIPYDLTYHNGNWYVMNMVKKLTSDDIDFTTYSTEEQVVGTWIDGKTVYRKVITYAFDNPIPSGITPIPHNISGISEIIGIDSMYQLGWDQSTYGDESYLAMNGYQVIAGSQNITIINVGQNSWSGKLKFILSYTKSTDQ